MQIYVNQKQETLKDIRKKYSLYVIIVHVYIQCKGRIYLRKKDDYIRLQKTSIKQTIKHLPVSHK